MNNSGWGDAPVEYGDEFMIAIAIAVLLIVTIVYAIVKLLLAAEATIRMERNVQNIDLNVEAIRNILAGGVSAKTLEEPTKSERPTAE